MIPVDQAISTTTIVLGVLGVVLSLPAWLLFLRAALKMYGFIRSGQPLPAGWRTNNPVRRLSRVVVEVFGHTHFKGRPVVNAAHWLVMVGFLFGVLVWFEAYIQTFNPAGGWPLLGSWGPYRFVEEVLAVGTIAGILALIIIRLRQGTTSRASRFFASNHVAARTIEAIVLLEGLGMLLVKAGKIATFNTGHPVADFLSIHLATLLPASPVMVSAFALLKLLGGMAFLLLMARNLDWGVGWHRFLSYFNIFFQTNPDGRKATGRLKPMTSGGKMLTLENTEDEDTLGVGKLGDASWKMLLDASTCTDCGRCQDLCPAWNTGKPLNPKLLMTDIRDAAFNPHADLDVLSMTSVVPDDVLWACTNCGACVDQCPVDIEHLDHVADLRRFRVLADSEFPSELTGLFKNLEAKGNPWGRNKADRASWVEAARADGIPVPVVGDDIDDLSDTEYLFWVGCAGAFDDDGVRTTRAVVELLHTAGVKFAVLSTGETCTGDPARRAGNEFLFQMLATENIATLNDVFDGVPAGQRKIITTCPHCFNTIRNEYPDFDGHFDVFHHTQLLNRLVREKLLTPVPRGPENRRPVTYHDPCFLGRHNQVYDPPRELVAAAGASLVEISPAREEAFCCGAGGARMYMEETIGRRVNEFRSEQALATGAEEIATGCPFCNTMFTGGVKALVDAPDRPAVRDVAQMLRDSVLIDGHLPSPREPQFLGEVIRPKRRPTETPAAAPPAAPKPVPTPPTAPAVPVAPAESKPAPPTQGAAAPGSAVPPAPGAAAPAVTPAPGVAVPSAPDSAIPPAPGSAVPPAPGAATPAVPSAPGSAVPPAPGAAAPAAPPAPGATTPAVPPAPGTSVPAAPDSAVVPAPGAAAPAVPSAPGSAVPPAPGAAAPAVPPAPGTSVPSAPGSAIPPAPGSAVRPAPGAATPAVPSAPGSAVPPAPGSAAPAVPPAPGSAVPPAPGSATPPSPGAAAPAVPSAPGSAIPPTPGTTTPAVPSAPGAAVPPAPGAAMPPAPGAATPAVPPAPGTAVPPPGGARPSAPEVDDN